MMKRRNLSLSSSKVQSCNNQHSILVMLALFGNFLSFIFKSSWFLKMDPSFALGFWTTTTEVAKNFFFFIWCSVFCFGLDLFPRAPYGFRFILLAIVEGSSSSPPTSVFFSLAPRVENPTHTQFNLLRLASSGGVWQKEERGSIQSWPPKLEREDLKENYDFHNISFCYCCMLWYY